MSEATTPTREIFLLPCATCERFVDYRINYQHPSKHSPERWTIDCSHSGCDSDEAWGSTLMEAIHAWNKAYDDKHALPAKPKYICSSCRKDIPEGMLRRKVACGDEWVYTCERCLYAVGEPKKFGPECPESVRTIAPQSKDPFCISSSLLRDFKLGEDHPLTCPKCRQGNSVEITHKLIAAEAVIEASPGAPTLFRGACIHVCNYTTPWCFTAQRVFEGVRADCALTGTPTLPSPEVWGSIDKGGK